jgi:hypothetical protein
MVKSKESIRIGKVFPLRKFFGEMIYQVGEEWKCYEKIRVIRAYLLKLNLKSPLKFQAIGLRGKGVNLWVSLKKKR